MCKGATAAENIRRILAVYYEQNVTTERFEDLDKERWIISEDYESKAADIRGNVYLSHGFVV